MALEDFNFRPNEIPSKDDEGEEEFDNLAPFRGGSPPADNADNDENRPQRSERGGGRDAERNESRDQTKAPDLKLSHENRQQPYAAELADIRERLATGKAAEELDKLRTWNRFYNTVEIDGKDGQKLQVSDTPRQGVYVVRDGDKTYLLNTSKPELDTKFAGGAPSGRDFDWSKGEGRREYKSMVLNAIASLDEQANVTNSEERDAIYKSILSLAEAAHKEGTMRDKEFSDELGYLAFRYENNAKDPGKGMALAERALALKERTQGFSAADTMNQRMHLIDSYARNGKPGSAESLLKKQVNALTDAEKDGRGLAQDISLQRGYLAQQLAQHGKKDQADKIMDRAYDMLLKNKDNQPLQDAGMSNTRRQLLEYYQKENKPDKVSKLFDQEIAALKSLQKAEPNSYQIPQVRDELIRQLSKAGDKTRLNPLLDEKKAELDKDATLPGVTAERLQDNRVALAQKYLQAENPKAASEVGKQIFDSAEKTMSGATGESLQQRLALMSKLAGVSDTQGFKDFSNKTTELFRDFEKSGKAKPEEISEIRQLLIERAESDKDGKKAAGLIEEELAYLEKQNPKSQHRIDAFNLSLGNALEMQGKSKEAVAIFEKLASEAKSDDNKIEALEKLAEVFTKLGKTTEAQKAADDAKALQKGKPPQHYKAPLYVN